RQRGRQPWQVVEREAAFSRFQPAQCGHVDARPAGHVLQGQPALHAQLAQPAADPDIDSLLVFCLHGKPAWQDGEPPASSKAWTQLMPRSTGSSTTASVTGSGASAS